MLQCCWLGLRLKWVWLRVLCSINRGCFVLSAAHVLSTMQKSGGRALDTATEPQPRHRHWQMNLSHPLGQPPVYLQEHDAVAQPARVGSASAMSAETVLVAPCEVIRLAGASDGGALGGAPAGRAPPPGPPGASERSSDTALGAAPANRPSDASHDAADASRAALITGAAGAAEVRDTATPGTASAQGAVSGACGALAAPLHMSGAPSDT